MSDQQTEFPTSGEATTQPSVDEMRRDLRLAAMNLLARREHSFKELCQKLGRRSGDSELLLGVLETLREQNLQSDARFAEGYVYHRSRRGYGPQRIRRELQERGIDRETLDLAFETADVDWSSLAADVERRKFGDVLPDDARERARRQRFMFYRGFSRDEWDS